MRDVFLKPTDTQQFQIQAFLTLIIARNEYRIVKLDRIYFYNESFDKRCNDLEG